jgi:hypothetical protein
MVTSRYFHVECITCTPCLVNELANLIAELTKREANGYAICNRRDLGVRWHGVFD